MDSNFLKVIKIIQLLVVCASTVLAQQQKKTSLAIDLRTVTNRLIDDQMAENVTANEIGLLSSSLLPDGAWPAIDYVGVTMSFPAEKHLQNMKKLALGFSKKGSAFYHDQQLKANILLACEFYFNKKPKSLNWWYNDIGGPQAFMETLILMKDYFSETDIKRLASYLKDATNNQAHRGMNRVWVSSITIYKGCLENDDTLVMKGFQSLGSTLEIAEEQGAEGIKSDNSFHQHRPQLYSGGYGMGFAESMASLMVLATHTTFAKAFSDEKVALFSAMLLQGHQLFGYRDAIDFGTMGRNISRPNSIKNISSSTLEKLMLIDPKNAPQYKMWKDHLTGKDFSTSFLGNKYFWKSDIMTQHGSDSYLSAKVISTRTAGTEMLNGENLKGYNLPLGATNIMTTGEEYRNIFPIWDWTRVPGTTGVMNQAATVLPWYLFGTNEFAGGVSDTKTGAIAYEHSYNGVKAKKGYFFTDEGMACLGTDINAWRTQAVVTSVNQCLQNGEIIIGDSTAESGRKFIDTLYAFKKGQLKWVFHDGVGYYFPNGGDITLKSGIQTGSWRQINESEEPRQVSQKVFSIWFNHSTAPQNETYQYVVIPAKTLVEFKQKLALGNLSVLANTKSLQALKSKNRYFMVFYCPGEVELSRELKITVDAKVVMLIEEKERGFQISVSDPTHEYQSVKLTINQPLLGDGAVGLKDRSTSISFKFPKHSDAGKTVTGFFQKSD